MSVDMIVKDISAEFRTKDCHGKFIVVDDNAKLLVYGSEMGPHIPDIQYHIDVSDKFGIGKEKVMGGGVFHYFAREKAFELAGTSSQFGGIPHSLNEAMIEAFNLYFKSKRLDLNIDVNMSPLPTVYEVRWSDYLSKNHFQSNENMPR